MSTRRSRRLLVEKGVNISEQMERDERTEHSKKGRNDQNTVSSIQTDSDDSDTSDVDMESMARTISDKLRDMMSVTQSDDSDSSDSDIDEESEDDAPFSTQFVIDKSGNKNDPASNDRQMEDDDSDSDSDSDSGSEYEESPDPIKTDIPKTKHEKSKLAKLNPVQFESDSDSEYSGEDESVKLSSSLQSSIDPDKLVYIQTDIYEPRRKKHQNLTDILLNSNSKGSELLKKSVVTPDFEKKTEINPYELSQRKIKKQNRLERSKTNGTGWFDMEAPEMTEEKKNDLTLLKMRRSLNPKQFYKAPDIKTLPKFFQMGRVIETAADFYHSRIPKKQRKKTLVEELMADADFRQFNKRKYTEIQQNKMKFNRGKYKHMKRLKKKKK